MGAVCTGEECGEKDSWQYVQERSVKGKVGLHYVQERSVEGKVWLQYVQGRSVQGMAMSSMYRRGVWRVSQWAVCTGEVSEMFK